MNTADRSLSIVDYALRRRFSFLTVEPCFNQNFIDKMMTYNFSEEFLRLIINKIENINFFIVKDPRLGKGYKIGHSYFSVNNVIENEKEWFKEIIENEIGPLLYEYWFDEEEVAKELYFSRQAISRWESNKTEPNFETDRTSWIER